MTISQNTIDKLIAMQALCVEVEKDNRQIETLTKSLLEAQERRDELSAFFQSEWLELLMANDENKALEDALSKHIPEGHYSILDEDTIWIALIDHRLALLDLLKTVVPLIE